MTPGISRLLHSLMIALAVNSGSFAQIPALPNGQLIILCNKSLGEGEGLSYSLPEKKITFAKLCNAISIIPANDGYANYKIMVVIAGKPWALTATPGGNLELKEKSTDRYQEWVIEASGEEGYVKILNAGMLISNSASTTLHADPGTKTLFLQYFNPAATLNAKWKMNPSGIADDQPDLFDNKVFSLVSQNGIEVCLQSIFYTDLPTTVIASTSRGCGKVKFIKTFSGAYLMMMKEVDQEFKYYINAGLGLVDFLEDAKDPDPYLTWTILPIGNNLYQVIHTGSNKCLELVPQSDGTSIVQLLKTGYKSQQFWYLKNY